MTRIDSAIADISAQRQQRVPIALLTKNPAPAKARKGKAPMNRIPMPS
ncbi:hypothetical protein LY622_16310 [Halomonas sp. M5N1S17]|nr:hypothetical protein [Halomonas alkalisoli]MCE9664996.1 hypothetical protein [Halomonas alkalisoli]